MNLKDACVHVHIKGGKIANAFSHLSGFPDNCVIHLVPSDIMTIEEFRKTHPEDVGELEAKPEQRIHDLGDGNYKPE